MKPKSVYFITMITFLSFFSCNDLPQDVKQALELAGNNKEELQKVIDYYQAPEDSLKLKAAYFLIGKVIPFSSSYSNLSTSSKVELMKSLNKILSPYYGSENKINSKERIQKVSNLINQFESKNGKLVTYADNIRLDVEILKASFLIENIDLAFEAWKLPWSKNYTFQQFCKYILPYTVDRKQPDNWRSFFYKELEFFIKAMGNEKDAIVVATKLNEIMQKKFIGIDALYDSAGYFAGSEMWEYSIYGNCSDISTLISESMRAIGIPATEILISRFGKDANDHIANAVLDTKGKWYYFSGLFKSPGGEEFRQDITKVYRKKIVDFDDISNQKIKTLNRLGLWQWEDITRDVTNTFDFALPLIIDIKKPQSIYLCIFNSKTFTGWTPIDWIEVDSDQKEIIFKNIGGKDVVYIAMIEDGENKLKPASVPFILESDGRLKFVEINDKKMNILLERKYPVKDHLKETAKSLIGSRFEGSNSLNFKNSETLYTIEEAPYTDESIIDIKPKTYRYYRFVYPKIKEGFTYNLAELAFGNKTDGIFTSIEGKYIASKGLNKKIIDICFDKDLLTYATINKEGDTLKSSISVTKEPFLDFSEEVWIGLDLGISKNVSHISFSPQTAKNAIYSNMDYELFYWDNKWVSLGVKKANKNYLIYKDVPKGALFWLKNHTEGKEERIFTYENEKQIWW